MQKENKFTNYTTAKHQNMQIYRELHCTVVVYFTFCVMLRAILHTDCAVFSLQLMR